MDIRERFNPRRKLLGNRPRDDCVRRGVSFPHVPSIIPNIDASTSSVVAPWSIALSDFFSGSVRRPESVHVRRGSIISLYIISRPMTSYLPRLWNNSVGPIFFGMMGIVVKKDLYGDDGNVGVIIARDDIEVGHPVSRRIS